MNNVSTEDNKMHNVKKGQFVLIFLLIIPACLHLIHAGMMFQIITQGHVENHPVINKYTISSGRQGSRCYVNINLNNKAVPVKVSHSMYRQTKIGNMITVKVYKNKAAIHPEQDLIFDIVMFIIMLFIFYRGYISFLQRAQQKAAILRLCR